MDLSICTEEGSNCNIVNDNNRSTVDILVNSWGYTDLLPENVPLFDKVPYQVHLFVATLLILLCKSKHRRLSTCSSPLCTANRAPVYPTAFCSVPFQDVIQKQF